VERQTVLLISANSEALPAPVYPLGLAYLAGAVERAGHVAHQYDVLAHGAETLPQVLQDTRPDLVAVSIRNVDNTDGETPRSYVGSHRELIAAVRRHTRAPIVLGGSGFSLFPQQLLRALGADSGIAGPGEAPLCALLDARAEGREPAGVPSLVTRAFDVPGHIEADGAIGAPKHAPELIDYYWREGGMIGLQTKRGCTRSCSYCTYPLIDGPVLRHADARASADQVARLFRDHGVRYFFVVDSVFNLDPEREVAFAEELCRLGAPVQWGAFFAPTRSDRAYWETLKRSGLTHVELGTDSLCDAMLASYRKDFTVADVCRTTALCEELRLFCAHYLILGGPGETPDTVRQTVAHAERLPRSVLFPFAGVRVYPGTALYARAKQDGQVRDEDDCLEPKFYFAEGLDAPRIWQIRSEQTNGRQEWVLPSRYPQLAPMMRHLRRSGMKGPLWELLLK